MRWDEYFRKRSIVFFAAGEDVVFQAFELVHQFLVGGVGFQFGKGLGDNLHFVRAVLRHFELGELFVRHVAGGDFDNLAAELLAFFQTGLQIGKHFADVLHAGLQAVVDFDQPEGDEDDGNQDDGDKHDGFPLGVWMTGVRWRTV